MNWIQRRELKQIIETLDGCKGQLMSMSAEEEAKYYNLPSSLQDSERGSELNEASSALWDAWSDLEMVINNLKQI